MAINTLCVQSVNKTKHVYAPLVACIQLGLNLFDNIGLKYAIPQ